MSTSKTRPAEGIAARHSKTCRMRDGARCNCTPTYQAAVGDGKTTTRVRRTFPTLSAAKRWRSDAIVALRAGALAEARPKLTVREACASWEADARAGIVTTRSGDRYKPGAIRSYAQSLRLRVLDDLGDAQFQAVRRRDVQDLVDRLVAEGHSPSTVQGAVTSLRVVYGRARQRGDIDVLPTQGLKLPAVRGRRERFATPAEAAALLAALSDVDRPVWATAAYAGLRRGELMALRWEDVDLPAGRIRVRWSWDIEYGRQETKSRNRRHVPIPAALREHLAAHRLRQAPGIDLVFGANSHRPFSPSALSERADGAWRTAKLDRLTLHDLRHTYASFAIAAGVNVKALSEYMGHASIVMTMDRYGHLMPGNEAEAAGLLDAYLARAT